MLYSISKGYFQNESTVSDIVKEFVFELIEFFDRDLLSAEDSEDDYSSLVTDVGNMTV